MKISPRACPYCGSPARGNPCWYEIKHPDYGKSGGDYPCWVDLEYSPRRRTRWWLAGLVIVIAGLLLLTLVRCRAKDAPEIPGDCVELASREGVALPTNKAEARAARAKVRRLVIKGDALALRCWIAVLKIEERK